MGLLPGTRDGRRPRAGRAGASFLPWLAALGMGLATVPVWGRQAETGPLEVQLLCDTDSVRPGSPLRVGVYFELQKGWHIYWRNPGDSGLPPQVRWTLPAGFQAGELRWPAPERLGSGSVIDYGYQGSVLLPVELQTPGPALAAGSTVTLSAQVSWIVCKDVCLPGKAELKLVLPVRMEPGPVSASHARFQEADARLPGPMPPDWTAEATVDPGHFVLTLHGAGLARAAFFPLEPEQIDNAAPQTRTPLPGGLRLTLKKSDQMTESPARLDGVLALGPGRVYAVSASVRARSQ